MRRLLALLFLLPGAVLAQSPLGERIGPDLSPEEQRYFGLFPGVEGVQAVRVTTVDDSTRLIISRLAGSDTTYTLRPGQLEAIRSFVGSFESSPTAFLNPNWQLASSISRPALSAEETQALRDSLAKRPESLLPTDRPKRAGAASGRLLGAEATVPFVDPERSNVIIRRGDSILSGVILDADGDRLLLHPAAPYDWRAPQAVAIPASEIEWVELQPVGAERLARASPYIGAAIGLAFAGADVFLLEGGLENLPLIPVFAGAGALLADLFLPSPPLRGDYRSRLGSLSNRAAFREAVPVDFLGATTGDGALASRPAPKPGVFSFWRGRYGWINVAALRGVSSSAGASGAVQERVRIEGILRDTTPMLLEGASTPLAGLDIAVRPVPWVRLGATWYRQGGERPRLERESSEELTGPEVGFVSMGAWRGYAEFVLPSPRRGGFGVEASFGGGITASEATVERATTASTNAEINYSLSSSRSAPFMQATVELVAPRRTSFFVRWTSIPAPEAIAVPGGERESDQFPGLITYQRNSHEVTFSSYQDITWGTRLRL